MGGGEEDDAAEQVRELQDAAAGLLTQTWAEEEALCRRATALWAELRPLREAGAAPADSEKVRCSPFLPLHSALFVCARPPLHYAGFHIRATLATSTSAQPTLSSSSVLHSLSPQW